MPRQNTQRVTYSSSRVAVGLFLSIALTAYGCASRKPADSWKAKMTEARYLAALKDDASFKRLLILMADSHPDVSYAATEAIEKRSQPQYSLMLIEAVRSLPYEWRWYGYRACGNYQHAAMLLFLEESLKTESARMKKEHLSDDRNLFYIRASRDSVMRQLPECTRPATARVYWPQNK